MALDIVQSDVPRVIETLGPDQPEGTPHGFYVSVRDHGRYGLLLGPFDTHAEALAKVALARRLAHEVDTRSHFYAFGTAKVTGHDHRPGLLNELAEKGAPAAAKRRAS